MIGHLSARSRLTLLYTSLFAAGGIVLVTVTYLLLANNLHKTAPASTTSPDPQLVALCNGSSLPNNPTELRDLKAKCASLYANAVKAGAHAQGQTSLHNLLLYSLITLGAVTVLAAIAGWLVAGRILRPVHQLTAAARAAGEQDLTHRLALRGRHDELRELADTFDEMLDRLDRAFASQRQFIANASHELRTPLTVMRTSVDVVLAKAAPTPDELVGMGIEVRMAVDRAEAAHRRASDVGPRRAWPFSLRSARPGRYRRGRPRPPNRQRPGDTRDAGTGSDGRRRRAPGTARRNCSTTPSSTTFPVAAL